MTYMGSWLTRFRSFRADNVNGLFFVVAVLAITIGLTSLAEAEFRAADVMMNDIIMTMPEEK